MYNKTTYFTMAIKKQYLKSKPVCKVTFTVEAEAAKKSFYCWEL
ncbi:1,4-alpha-glucan branching enzyme [Algibacter lectus]|uniref:1,4-alpha-glucan branching enzyme n=1 Tax=Algibacter lectus TaxID=221126 RepID=A0A090V894_9FLAO|nr:1,4-alpha-glucan branching enzyme [Algibacter lectus]